jgi:hypothetical protein
MRSAPKKKTGTFRACLRSKEENDPLIALVKAKATVIATTGVCITQQLICVILKPLEYGRNRVQSHSRPSSIEIANIALLERRDRYEAK